MDHWTTTRIPRQDGKLAIVTGANSGIGLQASLELARAGCSVIMACRNQQKAVEARQRILAQAPAAQVEAASLDLASLASVRSFASSLLSVGSPLDLLINNAGVMALPERRLTADGFEMQFGTNHLGHFALTGLLLPALLAAPTARVVTVSSIAHRGGTIRFEDLDWKRNYRPWGAYTQSKLANILFGFELERRLERAGASTRSIVVHPGVSNTSLYANGPGRDNGVFHKLASRFVERFGLTEELGALPTLYGATALEAQGGRFYGPDGFRQIWGYPVEVEAKAIAHDARLASRLWLVSERLTGVSYLEDDSRSL